MRIRASGSSRPTARIAVMILGMAACPRAACKAGPITSTAAFTVKAAGQVQGNRVFRMVDQVMARSGWRDAPKLPDQWAVKRYEGTVREMADWWGLSDPAANWTRTPDGEYRFRPNAGTRAALDEWAIRAGLRPCIVIATSTIPAPLVEGGVVTGQYGYNVRLPSDYPRWYRYLRSLLHWLSDQYGRDRVRLWTFMLGIESDWQAKAVYPGTNREMTEADNRREYLKLTDWFHAACADELGPTVYVGVYWAFETQADDYLRHWAGGTNFATGKRGTRIGYGGFSDWTVIGVDPRNPFSLEGKARRDRAGRVFDSNAWAAGMVWKYDYIAGVADRYPALRGLDLGLPEAGYFDRAGATNAAGSDTPCDVVYADHRGAALRTMRTVAYAACPRIAWAWNRYALGTGDLSWIYADGAKPAQFHGIRIQQKLEGERMLPVLGNAAGQVGQRDLRVIASATDRDGITHRIVAVNFAEDPGATGATRVRIRLAGMAGRSAEVTEYRIDQEHNNWWPEWLAARSREGIPYAAGRNQSHLGTGLLYKPAYAPWQSDVIGTLRDEDLPKWLAHSAAFARRDALTKTGSRRVAITHGVATLEYDLPVHGVLYLELRGTPTAPVWSLPKSHPVVLAARPGRSAWDRTVAGLRPGAAYTVTCQSLASGRVMDYSLTAGAATAWGDRSARWNRLVATARADRRGRLAVRLRLPAQPLEPTDHVVFRSLEVRLSGDGAGRTGGKGNEHFGHSGHYEIGG